MSGPSLIDFHFSDVGNAERLLALYGDDIRYSHEKQKFLVWSGKHWEVDSSGDIYNMARDCIRELEAEAEDINTGDREKDEELIKKVKAFVLRSENDSRIRGMINQVKSRREAVLPETDKDIFVLNLKNGTLDLRTGELKVHERSDYITRLLDIEYISGIACPYWTSFLDKIFQGDREIIEYVQKSIGYSLTGSTEQQCFYMLYGNGANGKSTFLRAITQIMGAYSDTLKGSSLMVRRSDEGARGDLAKLQGKRFVWASELNEDQSFDESLIKILTGGDPLAVRFLYNEEFQMQPEFKMWIGTNKMPGIKGSDYGIWRRVRLIPFLYKFPEEERDERFYEKFLLPELPGIFNWAVEGCLAWQREGIKIPDKVKAAVEGYREEMDTMQVFIEDCCITGESYKAKLKELYAVYLNWCSENNEKELSNIKFSKKMKEKGFTQAKIKQVRYWTGIGIVDSDRDFEIVRSRQIRFA